MALRSLIAALTLTGFSTVSLDSQKICEGILPDEQVRGMSIPSFVQTGITEEQFNEILDRFEVLYAPYIKEKFGADFVVERLWYSDTVNAYASRQGNTWMISMHGGLARHEVMTPGAFLLVGCHEVSHHIGGSPKKAWHWASSEGQADYAGTMRCVREVMNGWTGSWTPSPVNEFAAEACDRTYEAEADRNVCYMSAMSGYELGSVLAALGRRGPVDFTTPDPYQIARTSDSHPAAQCRLDTYFHGAICGLGHEKEVSDTSPADASCWVADGMADGTRRRCWFQPTDFQ